MAEPVPGDPASGPPKKHPRTCAVIFAVLDHIIKAVCPMGWIKSAIHRAILFCLEVTSGTVSANIRGRSLALGTEGSNCGWIIADSILNIFSTCGHRWGVGFSVLELGTGWYPIVPRGTLSLRRKTDIGHLISPRCFAVACRSDPASAFASMSRARFGQVRSLAAS